MVDQWLLNLFDQLTEQLDALGRMRQAVADRIAAQTCPVKAGALLEDANGSGDVEKVVKVRGYITVYRGKVVVCWAADFESGRMLSQRVGEAGVGRKYRILE